MATIETNGKFLKETLLSLKLDGAGSSRTTASAQSIIEKVIKVYEETVGNGHVGKDGKGIPESFKPKSPGAIGLVYGRIQSGKTRAMIVSSAMAFDNGFKIVIVLTSNINDLVTQTHLDFTKDLKGVSVFTKDDELDNLVDDAKLDIENLEGRILLITSKGTKSLTNITEFLKQINAQLYPVIIFDDEGDQASLDTNTYKRSGGDIKLEPSSINKLIRKLRQNFPASVYVSVTGTPQAVLLQSASSDNRPSFIEILPAGEGYVGGDHFFNADEPDEDSVKDLIGIIPDNDQAELLNTRQPIPAGLKDAIISFLLSASAASAKLGLPDKGYQFLCHPSLRTKEQGKASNRIQNFLTQVKKVLLGYTDSYGINDVLKNQYDQLKKQVGHDPIPSLDELKKTIKQELLRKKLLVINAGNPKRQGIEYGPGFNFLIGGNTLGRGIAIPNLLVTYYVRTARVSQIDTMHQHARMFGYRLKTLPFTRLFTTESHYYRFRDIHFSDKGLRDFIVKNSGVNPSSFPVEVSTGLRATRTGVLDINTTDVVWPGMQIYPNYMRLPQSMANYEGILKLISKEFGLGTIDTNALEKVGANGTIITTAAAINLVSMIKTKSSNSWNDKTIDSVIKKLTLRVGQETVKLKFRNADRTIGKGGFLSSGTLSGEEQKEARLDKVPTLWIMSVKGKKGSKTGAGELFAFPTLVVPDGTPMAFVFSKE